MEFYREVGRILKVDAYPNESGGYGRWRRGSGEGRFPGYGVIRWHSENCIHVIFHTPALIGTYTNSHTALERIKCLIDTNTQLS